MDPEQLPLRDIHLPPSISWWPPAPGWWLLLLVILGAGLLAGYFYRRERSVPWHRIAERELQLIQQRYESTRDAHILVGELSTLLRRVCLSLYPRRIVAGLTGENWLAFLDQMAGMEGFRHGGGRVLATAPYQAVMPVDARTLLSLCAAWLCAVTRQSENDGHRRPHV
ncbi:MAG TPA: DUF4381 domain-containing protein [Gammaproteobacteria bacterium]|nr:DUF4381 domain-containing protein [Gammaproteobacteria bacterium]